MLDALNYRESLAKPTDTIGIGTSPPSIGPGRIHRTFRRTSDKHSRATPLELRSQLVLGPFAHRRSVRFALFVIAAIASQYAISHDLVDSDHWVGYGGTEDETHYSPLSDVNTSNVSHLGLAWWFHIPEVVAATSTPIEADGILYFTTGYGVVRAVDSVTGRLLWKYNPHVAKRADRKPRALFGSRGIAFWNNRIYIGTHDGRLISVDGKSGDPLWTVLTTQPGDSRIITGPPLVFNGKVMIGHGVADFGPIRGYVTAYDAETGRKLWRFFTVPGNPQRGFENDAMKAAARTWSGDWWKNGGGGAVWNAMTYDTELDRIYIGTSNGFPVIAKQRSPSGGDNLYLASIVALDANTGTYIWHYQLNPAETWDYDATNDIELARVTIDGSARRVLMQASKNGFFYVIDRDKGKLLSAEKFARVTWAQSINITTGRPVEAANARDNLSWPAVWPSGVGAHTVQPMAFNPIRRLAYIPVLDQEQVRMGDALEGSASLSGYVVAWDPISQREVWRVALSGPWSAGIATTAGNLIFQGRNDGKLVAYAADTGKEMWSFDTQVAIVGAPITYRANKKQYVSVLAGFEGDGSNSRMGGRYQARRLLAFSLEGNARLPPRPLR